jgi:hypothetical protein
MLIEPTTGVYQFGGGLEVVQHGEGLVEKLAPDGSSELLVIRRSGPFQKRHPHLHNLLHHRLQADLRRVRRAFAGGLDVPQDFVGVGGELGNLDRVDRLRAADLEVVIVGNSIRLASGVELGDALG